MQLLLSRQSDFILIVRKTDRPGLCKSEAGAYVMRMSVCAQGCSSSAGSDTAEVLLSAEVEPLLDPGSGVGSGSGGATTVMVQVAVAALYVPSSAQEMVIVAVPTPLAVTVPSAETTATDSLLDESE